jgi:hypothetical protein
MQARHVLIALLVAFGIAATAAALTTIRNVNLATSSISSPVSRI